MSDRNYANYVMSMYVYNDWCKVAHIPFQKVPKCKKSSQNKLNLFFKNINNIFYLFYIDIHCFLLTGNELFTRHNYPKLSLD